MKVDVSLLIVAKVYALQGALESYSPSYLLFLNNKDNFNLFINKYCYNKVEYI